MTHVAVDEQVEIDKTRPPTLAAHPAQRPLDLEQQVEERARRQRRLDGSRAVEERWLVGHADRLRLA